jgi:hypothetical protein
MTLFLKIKQSIEISMVKRLLFILLFIIHFNAFSQRNQKYHVSGQLIDFKTNEGLIGATVKVGDTNTGTVTDNRGNFDLSLPKGNYALKISHVGYISKEIIIDVISDQNLQIALEPDMIFLNEITILYESEMAIERVNRSEVGVERISIEEAKMLPVIFGEVDIIKTLQLKPGVKAGPEGTAGFYVRGGGNDQNLILVDHAPVYNPNHLFGFFSVFNSDAVSDVALYKAGFPSKYGGRLSSVLDVTMREAQDDSISIQGGIGLISSRLTVNIPLVKDRLSVMVSGRRTYVDAVTGIINRLSSGNEGNTPIPQYYFYDFNSNIQYKINDKHTVGFSGYLGNDFFNFNGDGFGTMFTWGNRSSTIKLKSNYSKSLKVENAVYYSGYQYRINSIFAGSDITLGSDINDLGFVSDWDFRPSQNWKFNWGVNAVQHFFSIGDFGFDTGITNLQQGTRKNGQEASIYFSADYALNSDLSLQAGIRNSSFFSEGEYYNGFEPRLLINGKISTTSAIKLSYARMYQYLHLVSTSTATLPTDIWHPTTSKVAPQFSDQIAIGSHNSVFGGDYFFSVEAYYKWIGNAIDFRDGAQIFGNPNLEDEFVFGRGWAYGFETFIEKKFGKTRGWLGYTLSWSYRQFSEINNGKAFFPRYDQRHDVSFVLMHQLTSRWSLSSTWVYGTGNFATIASGRISFQDALPSQTDAIPDYSGRNDFQMPASHRLDLGAVYKLKSKRGEADLTIGIYNAYSRRNPFYIFYQELENEQEEVTGFSPRLVSLFPVLPAVTYNFKF